MVLNKRDLERAFSPKNITKKSFKSTNENIGRKMNSGPSSNIKVFVRVRPFSDQEQNLRSTIKVIDDKMLVFDPKEETEGFFFHGVKQKSRDIAKRQNKEIQFIFDRVFSCEANNFEIYEGTTRGIISTLLEGYNCSVFVYGATGAGKTHTMLGNKENPGITCLTMTELYKQVDELKATNDIEIGITYLEVYNENVQDLINPSGPMHLRDDCNGGVLVAGLKVEKISNSEQLFQLLQQGNAHRTQHPTDANAESSRSHAVFQVYVKIQPKSSGEVKISKLSMIDLAGSERGSATGCIGARFKEGSNINKSLLALGNCINNLADGLRHIPYRDSKLTRLLKDSLGGNCHTVMIANVSPSTSSYEDTYNTLKYATRAKSIKSKLTKNVMSVNLRVEHYVNMCAELKKEVAKLNEKNKTLEMALRQPASSPTRADPSYTEKLNNIYREKKQIETDWLNLEAQYKLLQWRIRCKTLSVNHMKTLLAQHEADFSQDLTKHVNSVSQLEARANSLAGKMAELLHQKLKHNENFNKFTEEMETAKVTKLLQTDALLKETQCEVARMQIQQMHYEKIIRMQEKRLEEQHSLSECLSKICGDYHMILRGRNLVTDSMDSEYQMGVQMFKGLKSVTWIDVENGSDDEDGVALCSISVKPFMKISLPSLDSYTFTPLQLRVPEVETSSVHAPEPTAVDSAQPDLNGTFVFEPTNPDQPNPPSSFNTVVNTNKTDIYLPKPLKPPSTDHGRRKTPHKKLVGINKENCVMRTKVNNGTKFPCPAAIRPKSVLASRQNVQELRTPDTKVSLNGCKMIRDKERTPLHNQHPYVRPIKLKRLGASPFSTSKKTKGIKM